MYTKILSSIYIYIATASCYTVKTEYSSTVIGVLTNISIDEHHYII